MSKQYLANAVGTGNSLRRPNLVRSNGTVSGSVRRTDKLEFYRFTLSAKSSFQAMVGRLRANADLALLDRSGRVLVSSTKPARRSELIRSTLEAGTYFLRVNWRSGNTSYRLTWSSTAATEPIPDPTTLPDLTGASFAVPNNLVAGQSFTANFAIKNIGAVEATSSRITFYLSNDPTITSSDRLLGSYDYTSAIAAGQNTGGLTTILSLPDAAGNFVWNGNGTYYIGMIVGSNSATTEANLSNNANVGIGIDTTPVNISGISTIRPFTIQFDYRFDTNNWFTPERKATLESAARIWENVIQDDFPDIPAGQTLNILNPQPIFTSPTSFNRTSVNLTLNEPIDDLIVFVGAADLGNTLLGQGGASAFFEVGSALEQRYLGNSFQPWTGSILFTTGANWFFDQTPNTSNDLPANQNDFLSVALHEIGHILGITDDINAFKNLVANSAFTGANAVRLNGGNPIPLSTDISHIQPGYRFGSNGQLLMEPQTQVGSRQLPTVLDAALLDDIGYSVNYNATFQNSP